MGRCCLFFTSSSAYNRTKYQENRVCDSFLYWVDQNADRVCQTLPEYEALSHSHVCRCKSIDHESVGGFCYILIYLYIFIGFAYVFAFFCIKCIWGENGCMMAGDGEQERQHCLTSSWHAAFIYFFVSLYLYFLGIFVFLWYCFGIFVHRPTSSWHICVSLYVFVFVCFCLFVNIQLICAHFGSWNGGYNRSSFDQQRM